MSDQPDRTAARATQPDPFPFDGDTLVVPCYRARGTDDPGLLAWQRDHPDWFIAGTWTEAPRRKRTTASQTPSGATAPIVTPRPNHRPPTPWQLGRQTLRDDWAAAALNSASVPGGLPAFQGNERTTGSSDEAADDAGTIVRWPDGALPNAPNGNKSEIAGPRSDRSESPRRAGQLAHDIEPT